MLYKKTKNKQEGKPKDINSLKNNFSPNSVAGKMAEILKNGPVTAMELSRMLEVPYYYIHQAGRKYSYFDGVKQLNPLTGRWETYYSEAKGAERVERVPEKLIKFLSKKPDMMYPAVYLSKKLNIAYQTVSYTLRKNPNVEIVTEREGNYYVKYYSIKS